jgi:CHAD domain-containing protein
METSEPSLPETTKEFAHRLFRELHQAILQHETGALSGNVESVHYMRVGIRRLRVAMNNFAACFRKKERRLWRLQLENLANALGGVRDLDVMIEALKAQVILQPEPHRRAILAFVRRLRARRRRALLKLKSYLASEEYAEFKHNYLRLSHPQSGDCAK